MIHENFLVASLNVAYLTHKKNKALVKKDACVLWVDSCEGLADKILGLICNINWKLFKTHTLLSLYKRKHMIQGNSSKYWINTLRSLL